MVKDLNVGINEENVSICTPHFSEFYILNILKIAYLYVTLCWSIT